MTLLFVNNCAEFSDDRVFRYALWRIWDTKLPRLMIIGLNPSTADEQNDDPTIRKCVGFAKLLGYGAIDMLNLFAFRATDPKVMMAAADPIGPWNAATLVRFANKSDRIIAAWGAHGGFMDRAAATTKGLVGCRGRFECFGVTKEGHPRHPLYLPYSTPLIPYPPEERKS